MTAVELLIGSKALIVADWGSDEFNVLSIVQVTLVARLSVHPPLNHVCVCEGRGGSPKNLPRWIPA